MITVSESLEHNSPLPHQGAPKQAYYVSEPVPSSIPMVPVMGSFVRSDKVTSPHAMPAHATTTKTAHAPLPPSQFLTAPIASPQSQHNNEQAPEDDTNDQGTDEETGVIRCICLCDDDDGFTIQCDRCLVWQHCACFGMSHASVPDEYLCEKCDPRPVDMNYARAVQRRRLQDEARKAPRAQQNAAAAAAATMLESAANVAWDSAVHGTKTPIPRRRQPSSRSPQTRPQPDHEITEDLDLNTPSATRTKSRNRRSRSGSRKSVSIPARSKGSDEEDAYTRVDSWQMEFTRVDVNHVREQAIIPLMARHIMHWKTRNVLPTVQDDQGFYVAPLRDGSALPPSEEERVYVEHGLAAVGHECVPIEMHCALLSESRTHPYVRNISDQVTGSFFNNIMHLQSSPSEPQNVWSASKMFCRPSMHGLFSDTYIPAGAFIMEYCGELYSADTYRANPINQYAKMGTPKPHVHLFPRPLNMAIDARMYGNQARFARSSCHPNAVLRPILHYDGNSDMPKLVFGLFAIAPISKSHEITVGWEWDDHHIVHVLPTLARHSWAEELVTRASPKSPPNADEVPSSGFPYASSILADKFNQVLSILLSYATCGCLGPSLGGSSTNSFHLKRQNCAVTQMLRVSQGMPLLYTSQTPRNSKTKPITFEPLVGTFRHWVLPMKENAETHFCAKLSQNGCYVQRVSDMVNSEAWPLLSESVVNDEMSEAESESSASTATEMVQDDREFMSEDEDALVKKALQCIEAEELVLPLKKRASRTHTSVPRKLSSSESRSRSDTPEPRPSQKRTTHPTKLLTHEVGTKRQKRELERAMMYSSDDDEAPPSPSRHVRKKSVQMSNGKRMLKHKRSGTLMTSSTRPQPSSSPHTAPMRDVHVTHLPSSTPLPVTSAPLTPAGTQPHVPLSDLPAPPVEQTDSSLSHRATTLSAGETQTPDEDKSMPDARSPPAASVPQSAQPAQPAQPAPPPKRLSLAEYKERLSSRRKSENTARDSSAEPSTPAQAPGQTPSPSPAPLPAALTPPPVASESAPAARITQQAESKAPKSPVPTIPSMERSGIRSVVIPQSPPRSGQPLTNMEETPLHHAPADAPILPPPGAAVSGQGAPVSSWCSPVRPPLPSSFVAPPAAATPPPPRPPPSTRAPPPPSTSLSSARPPPPGPPPGPPPPMPARLRAAQIRVDERNRQAMKPPRTSPVSGLGRGDWRPVH